MYFKTIDELKLWLIIHKKDNFDGGSQGECFKVGDKVYKIFIQFIDDEYDEITEYDKTDIMQFSSIINNTYIWPNDTIMVGDIVVGYITNYVDAKQLCNINPLRVDLDKFDKNLVSVDDDIKKISDNGVKSFDVMYNILYGKVGFKIIDSLDYSKTDMNSSMLYKINCKNFYYGIRMFLVYGIFEDFVFQNKSLEKLFNDEDASILDFLRFFRKELSDREEIDIKKLGDAKKSIIVRKRENPKYIRGICKRI